MTHLFSTVLILSLSLLGQAQHDVQSAPSQEEIDKAIQELGAAEFAVRTEAMERLWQFGPAAETAIEQAAKSGDREVAMRARSILEKFKYGIYPDTPADVVTLINQFRFGDISAKQSALTKLREKSQFNTALKLLKTEIDETTRQSLQSAFVRDIETEVRKLIVDGRYEQAEFLLELAATTSEGMRNYAAFLLLRGKLGEQIAQLEQQRDPADATRHQLLAYLHRTKGDLPMARAAADQAGDPFLSRGILFELSAWRDLAEQQPDDQSPLRSVQQRCESLGFAVTFQRLADNEKGFAEKLAAIKRLVESSPETAGTAAEAYLINLRIDDAIKLLANENPDWAFQLLVAQQRYPEAFELAGVKNPAGPDEQWFAAALRDANSADGVLQRRFMLTIEIAKVLHQAGQRDQAADFLARMADAVKNDESGSRLNAICEAEYNLGLKDAAFARAALSLTKDKVPFTFGLFYKDASQADAWWTFFQQQYPDEKTENVLRRIERLVQPGADVGLMAVDLDKLVEEAAKVESIQLSVVAATCLAHKRSDLARRLLEQDIESNDSVTAKSALAQLCAGSGQWAEAAKWHEAAWNQNPNDVSELFLAGHASTQAGREEEGRRKMELAMLLPLADASQRKGLADAMKKRELLDEAKSQWRLIMRSGAFQDWYVNNAAQNLGNAIAGEDPLLAADCWERLMLSVLKTSSAFVEPEGYLLLPHLVHKARAQGLLANGEADAAVKEIWQSLAASPANVKMVEDLVPLLTAAGRRDDADKLFDQVYRINEQSCQLFPQSASHRNNLAWMAARCDRRLNDALALAERAVELEPESAAYVDTLAEAHFRLGNRERAIEFAQRCLTIEPNNEYFQAQLKRFEDGAAN